MCEEIVHNVIDVIVVIIRLVGRNPPSHIYSKSYNYRPTVNYTYYVCGCYGQM